MRQGLVGAQRHSLLQLEETPKRRSRAYSTPCSRGDTQTSTAQTRRYRRETLRRWRRRAAPRARAVDEEFVTDLSVRDLELDEQWSFAGSKKAAFAESAERGEAWWHKAMARETQLLVEQFVAARTPEAAELLVNRSFDRLASGCLPQVSSEGYDAYTQPLSEQVRALTVYPLQWALMKGRRGRPPKPKQIPGVGEACGVGDALAGGFCADAPDAPMRIAVKRSRARTA
ncbi:MAG: hypothetical protein ACJ74Q_02735 [Pyrinomonadaceae bacterium]